MSRFWSQALEIARRDLRIEGRSGEALLVTVPFGLAALFLIPLALPTNTELLRQIGPGMFWIVTLLFGMFITFRQSAAESPVQRELLSLLGVEPSARFTGRVLASALLLVVFEAVLAPAAVAFYDPAPVEGWGWLLLIGVLAAAGMAVIGTLAGDVTTGLRTRTTLAPLLVAPLSVPLLIPAASAVESLRQEGSILIPALLMVVVVLGLAVIGILTARSLEEATR